MAARKKQPGRTSVAKATRSSRKTTGRVATRKTTRGPTPSEPTIRDVEERAYFLYLERGGEAGRALDDWLQAEREFGLAPGLARVASVAQALRLVSRG